MPYNGRADGRFYEFLPKGPADPIPDEDAGQLYTKEIGGVVHLFFQTDTGVVYQLSPPAAAPPVTSVFGRIGAVVAVLGDYLASLVSNDSTVTGATVADALNTLNTGKAPVRLGVDARAASHVVTASDINRLQKFTAAGAVNLEVNIGVLQEGDVIPFAQYGTGQVTVNGTCTRVAGGGLIATKEQYSYCAIIMQSGNEVLIVGDRA